LRNPATPFSVEEASGIPNPSGEWRALQEGGNRISGWLPPMRYSKILLREGSDNGNTHLIFSGRIPNKFKTAISVPRGQYLVFLFISSTFPFFPRTDRKTLLHPLPFHGKHFPERGKFFLIRPQFQIGEISLQCWLFQFGTATQFKRIDG